MLELHDKLARRVAEGSFRIQFLRSLTQSRPYAARAAATAIAFQLGCEPLKADAVFAFLLQSQQHPVRIHQDHSAAGAIYPDLVTMPRKVAQSFEAFGTHDGNITGTNDSRKVSYG